MAMELNRREWLALMGVLMCIGVPRLMAVVAARPVLSVRGLPGDIYGVFSDGVRACDLHVSRESSMLGLMH